MVTVQSGVSAFTVGKPTPCDAMLAPGGNEKPWSTLTIVGVGSLRSAACGRTSWTPSSNYASNGVRF